MEVHIGWSIVQLKQLSDFMNDVIQSIVWFYESELLELHVGLPDGHTSYCSINRVIWFICKIHFVIQILDSIVWYILLIGMVTLYWSVNCDIYLCTLCAVSVNCDIYVVIFHMTLKIISTEKLIFSQRTIPRSLWWVPTKSFGFWSYNSHQKLCIAGSMF